MSQPAISAGVAGRPRLGPSGTPAPPGATPCVQLASVVAISVSPKISSANLMSSPRPARSRVDIRHLAARGHAPGLDAVVVIGEVHSLVGQDRRALGLDRPGVVDRP